MPFVCHPPITVSRRLDMPPPLCRPRPTGSSETPLKISRDLTQAMIGFNQAFWNPLLRMYGVIPPPKDGKRV